MGDSSHLWFAQFTGCSPFDGGDSDGVHCKPSVRLADRALPRLFILKNCFTFDTLKPSFKSISTAFASWSLLRRSVLVNLWTGLEFGDAHSDGISIAPSMCFWIPFDFVASFDPRTEAFLWTHCCLLDFHRSSFTPSCRMLPSKLSSNPWWSMFTYGSHLWHRIVYRHLWHWIKLLIVWPSMTNLSCNPTLLGNCRLSCDLFLLGALWQRTYAARGQLMEQILVYELW